MVSFLIISPQTTYILDIQANMFPCPIGQGIGVFRTDLVSVDDGRVTKQFGNILVIGGRGRVKGHSTLDVRPVRDVGCDPHP